ncbi:MAG: response regulator transcription factor [Candidatus Atribacteria bacterium]|nr:response regulator transcription factor [Candidatus Atribacteria bacterium]
MVPTMNQIIKVFLVDDNRFFLEGLAYIIATNQQLQVVGTANTGKEALKKINEANPNVIVTDLVLPDINGIRLAKEILNKKNNVRVIVLSIYKDPEFIKAAKKVGVFAYLYKDESVDQLNKTIIDAYRSLSIQPTKKV